MRTLFYIAALLLITVHANAQWMTTTHTTGTVLVGTTNVTISGGGTAATYPLWCGVTPYWIGAGTPLFPGPPSPGWYDYSFSPAVNAIRVSATAMNRGETVEIWLNGVPYVLSASEWMPWAGTCTGMAVILTGTGVVECTADLPSGSGTMVTVRYCGINSCRVRTTGYGNGTTYTFEFNDSVCFRAQSNSTAGNPVSSLICAGDSLKLFAVGDTVGATYAWIGPGGFTSTDRDPFRFPSTMADTGMYRAIRTVGTTHDTSYVRVAIKPIPAIFASSNSPVCVGTTNTISLFATPDSSAAGETFTWSGPGAFTSTAVNPVRTGVTTADSGTYRVIANFRGCVDTAYTIVSLIQPPPAPNISGTLHYCQGQPFVPFTVTGYTGTLRWYTVPTGGTASTITPSVPTSTPGLYTHWVSQIIGSCEGPRSSITVRVTTTPPAPLVTGVTDYCQFIGPIMPMTVTPADSAVWYMSSVGGSKIWIEPLPNINVAAPLTTWVSRIDSGCEGPRTIVTINVHPKPAPPVVAPEYYCQFKFSSPISFTLSNPGDVPTFYGPGVTAGYPFTPTPPTSFAPDTLRYYITETTSHGCISDSVRKDVIIRLKPQPPTVTNVRYCQYELGIRPLNEVVDSDFSSFLNWYDNFANAITVPTPNTFTAPGTTTWWVGQTAPAVNGCASDSVPVRATIIYKPKFSIEVSKDWVCQFDSIVLAYKTAGVSLNIPTYQWTIPFGTEAVNKTTLVDSMITVRFDSAGKYNYVKLRASNENGMCYSDTTVTIRVIPKPTMIAYTKPDVCLGDTVDLALSVRSDNAYEYQWWVDYDTLDNAHALSIISGNSHSSGPYTISWLDTGRHVIKVTSNTIEGCKSDPTYDSVLVHNVPDATFRISSPNGSNICLEDSVQFTANEIDYRNSYYWTPEHDFFNNNHNKPVIWGKMLEPKGLITLKVTDPFGCYATKSMEINPDACCTIAFPNAFAPSPGGEAENNVFKPYFVGYHRFHIFRIVNRWGQTVFESHNSSVMGWDGTYDGVPQDMGVYYYFLRYDCGGKTLEAKGDVTLIR